MDRFSEYDAKRRRDEETKRMLGHVIALGDHDEDNLDSFSGFPRPFAETMGKFTGTFWDGLSRGKSAYAN